MNYALMFSMVGVALRFELALMAVPLVVSLVYGGSDAKAFLYSMAIIVFVNFMLSLIKPKDTKMRTRDGFMIAALSWIFISLFGALPFYFCGYFDSPVDCVFEAVSGFTTTGATVLGHLESLPRGIMFWRCFTHWIGGMGVLVFILAIMPSMSASSVNLLKVESTGPTPGKMLPKIRETAKYLYLIYLSLTVVVIVCLLLAGMPLYDTLVHSFTIAGTGGFSCKTMSIGAYNSPLIEFVFALFLFLFGVNYTLYFYMLRKEFKLALFDEELIFYVTVVVLANIFIVFNLTPVYNSVTTAIRYSVFQVSSVITTTGVFTVDYNTWPTFSKLVLVFLMLTGCCAGSTGGGIKLVRILLLVRCARAELNKILHPKIVKPIIVNNKAIDEKVMSKVFLFFFVYFAVMVMAMLVVSLDNFDLTTTLTAVVGALSNTGPGLGNVGPTDNYAAFSPLSKLALSFCMLAGRLELFPVLLMLAPSTWRRAM